MTYMKMFTNSRIFSFFVVPGTGMMGSTKIERNTHKIKNNIFHACGAHGMLFFTSRKLHVHKAELMALNSRLLPSPTVH